MLSTPTICDCSYITLHDEYFINLKMGSHQKQIDYLMNMVI